MNMTRSLTQRASVIGCGLLLAMSAACGPRSEDAATVNVNGSRVAASGPAATVPYLPESQAAISEPAVQQIRYGKDPAQFGWLTLPTTPAEADGYPLVVLLHGGFRSEPWDYTLMAPLAKDLASRGFATWNIEFRRLGGRGGWPTTFDDVDAAIEELSVIATSEPLNLNQVVLIGHSSGAHLGLWALGRPTARVEPVGAVGLGAIVDLDAFAQSHRLLGGTPDQVPDRFDEAAPVFDDRVMLVHGADDTIVALNTLAPAAASGIAIDVIDDTDHFDVIDPALPSWSAATEALSKLLSRSQ